MKQTDRRTAPADQQIVKGMGTNSNESSAWAGVNAMKTVLSNLHCGVVLLDANTREVLEVNDFFTDLTGFSRSDVIGGHCKDYICSSSVIEECVGDSICNGEKVSVECTMNTREGKHVPVLKNVSRIEMNGRECILESMVDIGAQKKVEHRLREERERVEKLAIESRTANSAKTEFLANVSHELRTPLNGVMGMASLLMESPLTDDQKCYAETMYACAESLVKLVNGVLDYSSLEAGRIELAMRSFHPRQLLCGVAETIRGPLKNKNLSLDVNIRGDVHSPLIGDTSRLQQVLMILADNALKFTEIGGVILELTMENLSGVDARLRFLVKDTGIGIPPEKHEQIFERFTQVDSSATRRHGGTGLGLATAREIIRLMGGEIGVISSESKGAEFWFEVTLPYRDQIQSGFNTHAPLRVLIVDDSVTNRSVLGSILQKLNCDCELAESGELAIEFLSKKPFDLVFMDIQMPGMTGIVTTKAIRSGLAGELAEDIPIVALSADDMRNDNSWQRAGMNHRMTKPVTPDHLKLFLENWFPSTQNRPERFGGKAGSEATAQEQAEQIFDYKKLLGRLMGDSDILVTVLKGYMEDIPNQIETLSSLIASGDMSEVKIRAHGIKGASATVCAERIAAHCALMEQFAELGDSRSLEDGIGQLRLFFNELKNFAEADILS